MDYRINPVTTQSKIKYQLLYSRSFKGDSGMAIIIPGDDMFIKQNNDDILADNRSSHEVFGRSLVNAWRNLKEVFPLIDPVNAFRDVMEETQSSKISKKDKASVNLDYAA
ncbi:MAG: hypothetical protein PHC34_10445 [Candidatus Gastranaerophilales bacterium]|nr:hypothetical protein [Candidatus Gastranaerophilales bacterium]